MQDGIFYIVMELVEGITLKNYIERKGRLSLRETVSIAVQAAMGVGAAHNNQIIHRDIKPQNIIISKRGMVKVMDMQELIMDLKQSLVSLDDDFVK